MLLAHDQVLLLAPPPVQFAEAAVAVAARFLLAVLLPQQLQRHVPVPLQLPLQVLEVRLGPVAQPRRRRHRPTVNQLLQRALVELGGQRPAQPRLPGARQHLLHPALRHPAAAGDLPLRAARLVAQPQYFLDVLHRDSFPRHRNLLSRKKVALPGDAATLHDPAVPNRTA